jgi:DNA processing protein
MSSPQDKYYNAFNLLPQIGPVRMRKLLHYFPTLEIAWHAGANDFLAAGLDNKLVSSILEKRKAINPDREFEKIFKEGIGIITLQDNEYPAYLREIPSAPALLYIKGKILRDEFCIGIVGSRKISDYGQRVAEDFSRGLSRQGVTLVSGMAYGADTIAHRQCVLQQHRTIAVLGSGLDEKSIYPSANRQLAREIADFGCLLSEYPIGMPPLRQNFPARNRIISGISRGLLVIEASATSGSLITARYALEHNREVFAVPGSIYAPRSEGTNNLIKMGAKSACKLSDILEEFNIDLSPETREARRILPENPEEELILAKLSPDEPLHIDKLAAATDIKTAPLSSLLTLMEMKGMIKDIGGMRYIKK